MRKRPTVLEVAALLREKGLLEHFLWTRPVFLWSDKDYKEWDKLNGVVKKPKEVKPKVCYATASKGLKRTSNKVIRLSDGKEFKSVRNCSVQEGLPITSLKYKIMKGIGYKYKDEQNYDTERKRF